MIIPHCHFEGISNHQLIASVTGITQYPHEMPGVGVDFPDDDPTSDERKPSLMYRGATYSKKTCSNDSLISPNNGHFGSLDCPAGFSKLHGTHFSAFPLYCILLLTLVIFPIFHRPKCHGGDAPHTLDINLNQEKTKA